MLLRLTTLQYCFQVVVDVARFAGWFRVKYYSYKYVASATRPFPPNELTMRALNAHVAGKHNCSGFL